MNAKSFRHNNQKSLAPEIGLHGSPPFGWQRWTVMNFEREYDKMLSLFV
jgi:hypothetical protein